MSRSAMISLSSMLAGWGRWLFPRRLWVGLAVAVVALEWLQPVPLFGEGYRAQHILAVLLIAGGLALRAWAAGCAGSHTRTARIEAPRLVMTGPFAYVRNPIYLGTAGAGLGMSLLIGDPVALACAICTLGGLYVAIVPAEEAFLLQQFGAEYHRYRAAVPRLIPRICPRAKREHSDFHWPSAWGEAGILLWLVIIYGALQFEEYLDRIGLS